jgi:hypothetical protein
MTNQTNQANQYKNLILSNEKLKILDNLSDEYIGKIFNAIRYYHKTRKRKEEYDVVINIALNHILDGFDEYYLKLDKSSNISRENGKKGGRPKGKIIMVDDFYNIIPKTIAKDYHFIYLIKDTRTNVYKIGETKNLFKRRLSLKLPKKYIKVVCFGINLPNICQEAEKQILLDYKQKRIRGDWLDLDNYDIINIKQLFEKLNIKH